MMIPGLKVVAPSTPLDVVGLLAASIRDPDPVVFLEHKSLMADKQDVPDGEVLDELGVARVAREGTDCTIVALALMVPRALEAAGRLEEQGISAEVVDVRTLVPLDTQTILGSVSKTSRLFTVEENPRLCGWGRRSPPSLPMRRSGTSTGRWSGSPRRTSRSPRPRHWRTWRFPPSIESPRRSSNTSVEVVPRVRRMAGQSVLDVLDC